MNGDNLSPEDIAMRLNENIEKIYSHLVECSRQIEMRLERLIERVKAGTISQEELADEKSKVSCLKNNMESLKKAVSESEIMLEIFEKKRR